MFERLWAHLDHAAADECRDGEIREVLLERVRRTARNGMPARALELGRRLDRSWTAADGETTASRCCNCATSRRPRCAAWGLRRGARPGLPHPGPAARTAAARARAHPDHRGGPRGGPEGTGPVRRGGRPRARGPHRIPRPVRRGAPADAGRRRVARPVAAPGGEYPASRERSSATWQRQCEVLGHSHPSALASALGHARDLRETGDYAGSVRVLRPALEELRGRDTHGALRATVSLSVSLRRVGRRHEADALAADAEKAYTTARDPDGPDALVCGVNLAALTAEAGDLTAARGVMDRLRHGVARLRGPEHPDNAVCDHNLAAWLRTAGEMDEALAAARRTVRSFGRHLGDAHPYTLCGRVTMANILADLGRFAEAESMTRDCARDLRARLGDGHPDTLIADLCLAVTLRSMGRTAEAGRLRGRSVSALDRRLGSGHPWTEAGRGWRRVDRDLEFLLSV
ncbi:tetratricopeptide repeat protein [Streptomyces zhihengii]